MLKYNINLGNYSGIPTTKNLNKYNRVPVDIRQLKARRAPVEADRSVGDVTYLL
jgi:hypothetical protein